MILSLISFAIGFMLCKELNRIDRFGIIIYLVVGIVLLLIGTSITDPSNAGIFVGSYGIGVVTRFFQIKKKIEKISMDNPINYELDKINVFNAILHGTIAECGNCHHLRTLDEKDFEKNDYKCNKCKKINLTNLNVQD